MTFCASCKAFCSPRLLEKERRTRTKPSICFPRVRRRHLHRERHYCSSDESIVTPSESSLQVDQALIEAESAVNSAQEALQLVSSLPSAYAPHPIVVLVKKMVSRLFVLLVVFTLVCMLTRDIVWMRYTGSLVLPLLIGLYSLRKKSLSPSGAAAAGFVGFGTFLAGLRAVSILLSFFISSSMLTKFKDKIKESVNADHKKGGQRDWIQVFSNGFFATIFSIIYAYSTSFQDQPLGSGGLSALSLFMFGCILGNYSCTCGDTWASELGVLSKHPPHLITTFKPVPRGTNGGVTILGLVASFSGGLFIGLSAFIATIIPTLFQPLSHIILVMSKEWPVIILGMAGGLLGSIIDSLLGATLQYSGFDRQLKKVVNRPGSDPAAVHKLNGIDLLSNNQVNLISSLIMALIVGKITLMIYN